MGLRGPKPGSGQKSGGRKKGTPNKKTQLVQEKLAALGCDPIERIVKLAQQAESEGDIKMAIDAYRDLAQYVTPKLKAIEHSGVDGEAIKVDNKLSVQFLSPKVFDD